MPLETEMKETYDKEAKAKIREDLSKAELEGNLRASQAWLDTIKKGQFSGEDSAKVATLIDFIGKLYLDSLAAYESSCLQHPQWGRPSDLAPKAPEVNQ